MKCPKCGGTGFVPTNVFGVNGAIKCDFCDGSGVFITNAVEPMTEQTNEEWFTSLSTEEKAKVLYRKAHENYMCGINGKLPIMSKDWEMWLKQPHGGES